MADRLPPMSGEYRRPGPGLDNVRPDMPLGREVSAREAREQAAREEWWMSGEAAALLRRLRSAFAEAPTDEEELTLARVQFGRRWSITVEIAADGVTPVWTARPIECLTPERELRASCAACLAGAILRAERAR